MGRKRVLFTAIAIVVIAGIIVSVGVARAGRSPASKTVDDRSATAKPVRAFDVRRVGLPAGWNIAGESSEYLNLSNGAGCFTTSALIVAEDYANTRSVNAFTSALVPRFESQGYAVTGIAERDLMVNQSGSVITVGAVYYELTRDGQTTYHVDGGIKGSSSYAFDGLSCGNAAGLPGAQRALLGLTYHDTYVPLSGSHR